MQRERFWRIMAQSVASLLELAIHENIANLLSCPAGLRYLPISLYILCESDLWWKSSLRSSQSSPATRTTTARRLRQNECGSSVVVEQRRFGGDNSFFKATIVCQATEFCEKSWLEAATRPGQSTLHCDDFLWSGGRVERSTFLECLEGACYWSVPSNVPPLLGFE